MNWKIPKLLIIRIFRKNMMNRRGDVFMKNELKNVARKNALLLAGIGLFFVGLIIVTLCLGGCTYNYYYTLSDPAKTDDSNPDNCNPDDSNPTDSGSEEENGKNESTDEVLFIRVNGTNLYNPDNSIYYIRSMGLGNDAFGERSEIPYNHHSQASYKELSEMGFNTVRFYLTYKMFETNENPYVYNSEVFDWIDSNIEWAQKYGMHLILDMQTPQGGYQSGGEGLALFKNVENQQRLAKLWGKIASYYKDCPVILGYDLVNEPQVPFDTNARTSVKAWSRLAQKCIDEIRLVDANHIIFAERITGIRGDNGYYCEPDPVYCFPQVTDDNLIFQGHFYDIFNFTHQGADWDNFKNTRESYPRVETVGEPKWGGEYVTAFTEWPDYIKSSWTDYSYSFFIWDSALGNAGRVVVKSGITGKEGSICIDNVRLYRVYPNGREEEIYYYNFDTPEQVAVWNFGGENNHQGTMTYAKEGSNGFIKVSGTQAHTWVTAPTNTLVPLEDELSYRMVVSIRFENMTYSTGSYGFDIEYVERAETFNKESIKSIINSWNTYPAQQNKPLFIGEFGCFHLCFEYNCGVDRYLSDCADVFRQYTCGYNYHVYHEQNFGLHLSDWSQNPSDWDLNRNLYDLLCAINKQ